MLDMKLYLEIKILFLNLWSKKISEEMDEENKNQVFL